MKRTIFVMMIAILGGCASHRDVYREVVHRDTLYMETNRVDSIYMRDASVVRDTVIRHDSIFVRADSVGRVVYKEVWKTEYAIKIERDTIYRDAESHSSDSILHVTTDANIERVVETKVLTKNSGFAKFTIAFFFLALLVVAGSIVWKIYGAKIRAIIAG